MKIHVDPVTEAREIRLSAAETKALQRARAITVAIDRLALTEAPSEHAWEETMLHGACQDAWVGLDALLTNEDDILTIWPQAPS